MIDHQITAAVGEPLRTDYEVHELFSKDPSKVTESLAQISDNPTSYNIPEPVDRLISVVLTARIEILEAENQRLHKSINASKDRPCLRIEHIAGDNKLVRLYTGFISYMVLINFFTFLGPAVNELSYWGGRKEKSDKRHRMTKLNPLNQFFLTLMKLKLRKLTGTRFSV